MSTGYSREELIALLKRSLGTIQALKEKQHKPVHEPIAIIGMSCRFPGGCDTPEKFWKFLLACQDATTEIPEDRFDFHDFYSPNSEIPGKMYTKYGSFLQNDIAKFDAPFFGISPREAMELDPQQRLLLELSWEALERAVYAPLSLRNTQTGVFIGQITSEYTMEGRENQQISPYTLTGILPNLSSGRIAHFFGLQGPAISVDTACSSSLVSTHLACKSLENHDCDLALAGGISLMISPQAFIMLSKVNALSPDGRCKAFDASADGYGRGEGGGIIVLKRLSDALRDEDNILALIDATKVNQDGASSGLTVPNGLAQQMLIQNTLEKANLKPNDISYIEAHGTGTPLGDPIEIQALTAIFGQGKRTEPLAIGTVKANIGHLEAAAGIAAIIKTVLCLQNNYIPAHPYVDNINPRIDLNAIPARLTKEACRWESSTDKARHAGVSSFGFSGTNAHCILSDAPKQRRPNNNAEKADAEIFTLSAVSETALQALISQYQSYLETTENLNFKSLCASANSGRHTFSQRVAFVVHDANQLKQLLGGGLQENNKTIFRGKPSEYPSDIAFFFNANASENYRESLNFYQKYRQFQDAWMVCADILTSKLGQNPLDDVRRDQKPYHDFAFDYARAKLWQHWGIHPSALWGTAAGVYVAACISGVMNLETALLRLMHEMEEKAIEDDQALFPPEISIIDSRNGEWLKKSRCLDPTTWVGALKQQPQIQACIHALESRHFSWLLSTAASEPSMAEKQLPLPETAEENQQMIAKLWCSGTNILWKNFYSDSPYEKLILPTYPFQRDKHWHEKTEKNPTETPLSKTPLTGEIINMPLEEKLFRFSISPENLPTLADTAYLLHVGYFVDMLKSSVEQLFNTDNYLLESLAFHVPLVAFTDKPTLVWLAFRAITDEGCDFEFLTEDKAAGRFRSHVRGHLQLKACPKLPTIENEKIEQLKKQAAWQLDQSAFYEGMIKRGVNLGESVQWIKQTWSIPSETLAEFAPLPDNKIPPGIWDACAQLFHATLSPETSGDKLYMVNEWKHFHYDPNVSVESPLLCHFWVDNKEQTTRLEGGFTLYSAHGQVLAHCADFTMIALEASMLKGELEPTVSGQKKDFLDKLKNADPPLKLALLQKYLAEKFSDALKMDSEAFDFDSPLMRYGIDSIIALECNSRINADLGVRLPTEAFIDDASIHLLAEQLAKELAEVLQQKPEESQQSTNQQVLARWFEKYSLSPESKIKLFCFPYGGGGASLYKDWQKQLPEEITVIPVQLPGRENRFEEQPIDNIDEMIDKLGEAFSIIPPGPCAFYGHSAGALIAWRLALRLSKEAAYKNQIKQLFVAGYSAPDINQNPWSEVFEKRLRAQGFDGIPDLEQLKQCPPDRLQLFTEAAEFKINMLEFTKSSKDLDFIRRLIAKLLSDMKLVNSFHFDPNEKLLDIPITAFAGTLDDRCSVSSIKSWKALTTGAFDFYSVAGDHFFLHSDQSQREIINIILSQLAGDTL